MSLSRKARTRLTKLADFLHALPRKQWKHFRMARWISHRGDHDHEFGEYIKPEDLQTCGTTACALGWAAMVPGFKRLGLKVIAVETGGHNIELAAEFFDIEDSQANHLFGYALWHDNASIVTPKQWAKKARAFIKADGVIA
jgi:hypothetical protein